MAILDLTWMPWDDHCNDALHNSDINHKLLDMDAINLAIIEEWHTG
jgi:hypothetical protein